MRSLGPKRDNLYRNSDNNEAGRETLARGGKSRKRVVIYHVAAATGVLILLAAAQKAGQEHSNSKR
jgi:hypothetical protein